MKKLIVAVFSLMLAASMAWAQPAPPPSGWRIQAGSTRAQYPAMLRAYTVATLPTGTTNDLVLATDCTAADDCSSGSGTHVKILVKTATGWVIVGDGAAAGAGDVGGVGDCTGGDCLDGTSDGGEWIRLYDGDSHYVQLDVGDLSGNITVNLPTSAGTLQLSALAENNVWVGNAGGVAEAVDSAGWDKDSSDDYTSGGTDVALADGGTGASLADPGGDRLMFWDDDPGAMTWLSIGSGLSISGTELTATGSGDVTSIGGTGEGACASGDCLDGTSDGGNFIRLYDGNSHYTQLAAGDSAGNLTFTFPTAAPGGNNATVVMSSAGAMSTVAQGQLPGISPSQGDILYYNGTSWVALTAGVSGQYLQTQGAAANPQWASTAISGDIEYVGDVESGAAFTADGGGNTLWFEGATANAHEILLTGADPTDEDKTITLPAATGTVVLGPATFAADNILIKTNYAAGTVTLTQATGITVDDNNDMSGGRNLNITGDLTVQGDDITLTTNTSGAVLVADGTNFNPVVMSGDITIGTDGATTIGNDKILTAHVNWGSEATQIDLDEVPDGTDYQRVAAADVDASGHVNVLTDIDGTGAITVTGPTETRAITIDDADQELAARNRANTFTENNTFGNADTDTLTIGSLLVGGNSRALWIAGSAPTPTYATGTNELYVAGDIETAGTVYANTFVSTATGDSYISLSNNSGGYAGTGYQIYFETDSVDVLSYSLNGSEKRVANLSDTQTFTAAKTFAAATSFNRGATGAGQLLIYEDSDDGSNYVTLTVPALAGNYTLTMPTTDGNSGQYLKTDGDGNTSWDTPTATAATDGSTEGVVQFNTSGAIDADASLKYTEASYTLLIGESNGSSLDGKLQLFNEGGTDYTVTIQPGTQSADATITLPGSTSTLATLGLAETFSGNKTFSGTVAVTNATEASAIGTASVVLSGGLGIAKDVWTGNDIKLDSDSATVWFGADQEVRLEHVADTGLLLSDNSGGGTTQLQFGDSGTYVNQPADGYLGLTGDTGVRITASDEDLQVLDNGANNIAITSTTGVDTITFYGAAAANAMNLATTGTILGAIKVQTAGTTAGADPHAYSPAAALMYGMLITIDDSDSVTTVNLPDYQASADADHVKIGASVCVLNLQAQATVIDPSADDKIRTSNGTLNGAGDSVTGPATIGAFSCFILTDASSDVGHWQQMGMNGAWPVTP